MSRIVDNGELTLGAVLGEALPHCNALDACVGYFNLRGWSLLRDAIGQMSAPPPGRSGVRLLVGMAISPHDLLRRSLEGGIKTPDLSTAIKLADQAVAEFADQLVWGAPTDRDRTALRQLRDDLYNGLVQVRFSARESLHAKLYLAHSAAGWRSVRGVVGSSNFTAAGLGKQGELSLEESDDQVTAGLVDWFEDRWDDRFTIDVTQLLIEVLDESWIREDQPNPYHVYLRLAYELSRDAREGRTLDIPPEVKKILLPHQISAVQVATRILERKGIAVIGDVVGLGKTLTGTAIAATAGESVLVIAPKNLVGMWEEHLLRFNIAGKVMSTSRVTQDLADLKRFRLMLIDESHNLRNRGGKAWLAIRGYIEENDSKVVLLTATMYNARHRDIGGQLALKLSPDEPLGVRPEKHIGKVGALALARRTGGRLDSLSAFDQSEENEDWQRLLSEYLVRRTRAYLEATYGKPDPKTGRIVMRFPDGTTFSFPKREPVPLKYDGGASDPNDRIATVDTFAAVTSLTYGRYQLGAYLKANPQPTDDAEAELIQDLQRAITSAAGFIRTMALKRLTSSAHAFMLTIKRMIARNYVLDYALTNDLAVPLGSFADQHFELDAYDGDADTDDAVDDARQPAWGVTWSSGQWQAYAKTAYESLLAKRPGALKWARSTLFDSPRLLNDIRADSETLQRLVDEFGIWDPRDDSKLQALARHIDGLPDGSKILVFSEYKDTVDYVAKHLPSLMRSGKAIASASGQSGDAARVARRFAPRANVALGGLPVGETEVDVLITTDVLSEGQNLQDAAIVVNWDLPWTIIKVIQRAGRVDRVGQSAAAIKVMSFEPMAGVESVIQLRSRLLQRLKNNAEMFGGGERFFTDDDYLVDLRGMFDGTADLSEDEGEVDASSYALTIWEAASEFDRHVAIALREVVFSTKPAGAATSASVITYGRTETGNDLIVRTTAADHQFITPIEALTATESKANDVAAPALSDHLAHVARSHAAMVDQAQQNTLLLHTGLRKRLYDYLVMQPQRLDLPAQIRGKASDLVDAITSNPLRESAKGEIVRILRSVKLLGDADGSALEQLLALHAAGSLVSVSDVGADRVQIVTSMGFNPANQAG